MRIDNDVTALSISKVSAFEGIIDPDGIVIIGNGADVRYRLRLYQIKPDC